MMKMVCIEDDEDGIKEHDEDGTYIYIYIY